MCRLKLRSAGNNGDARYAPGGGSAAITPYIVCTNQSVPMKRRARRLRDEYLVALDTEGVAIGVTGKTMCSTASLRYANTSADGSAAVGSSRASDISYNDDGAGGLSQSSSSVRKLFERMYSQAGPQALVYRTFLAADDLYHSLLGRSDSSSSALVASATPTKAPAQSSLNPASDSAITLAVTPSAPTTTSTPVRTPGSTERLERFLLLSAAKKQQLQQLALAQQAVATGQQTVVGCRGNGRKALEKERRRRELVVLSTDLNCLQVSCGQLQGSKLFTMAMPYSVWGPFESCNIALSYARVS